MIAVAREGCDLGTPEGRARFITQAKPLWSALPDGALKRQMLTELTRLADLPEGELQAQWMAAPSARASTPYTAQPRARGAYASSRHAPRRPFPIVVA